jgi:phosphate transport system permease protein
LIAIFGTVVTATIAILLAVPLSFGIAVFLTETCPMQLRRPLGTAIELLAAVPSIIYGMFGLFIFAPLFAEYIQPAIAATLGKLPVIGQLFTGSFNGIGILAAGLILAMMILPFIASVMRDVFEIVPPILKESAYGLGCTTWEVVTHIVLPYTKGGVVGGVMLGLGRALGETMAVTFVIGNAHKISSLLFRLETLLLLLWLMNLVKLNLACTTHHCLPWVWLCFSLLLWCYHWPSGCLFEPRRKKVLKHE